MIRLASMNDLPSVMKITADAKSLFKNNNSLQWQDSDGYPNESTFVIDIQKKQLYVYEDQKILGYVVVSFDIDNNYSSDIWLNNEEYSVIHRIAVDSDAYNKGVASKLFAFAENKSLENNVFNLRADTALDNKIMQHLFSKFNYIECGLIYLNRDTVLDRRRIAFHKKIASLSN